MLFHSNILYAANSWSTQNQRAIDSFLNQSYSSGIAVFDADGTLWQKDIGEAFLLWLIDHHKLSNVDYSKDIFAQYQNKVAQNTKEGYIWAVSLMAGLSENEIKSWANQFFKEHFRNDIFAPQKLLISQLTEKGIPVWIVSASNRWIIEAAAPYLGIDASKVIGISLEVENGILTNKIQQPVPYGEGKLLALLQRTPGPILYASGDSLGDKDLLLNATKMCTLIVNKDKQAQEILNIARNSNCNIQYW